MSLPTVNTYISTILSCSNINNVFRFLKLKKNVILHSCCNIDVISTVAQKVQIKIEFCTMHFGELQIIDFSCQLYLSKMKNES